MDKSEENRLHMGMRHAGALATQAAVSYNCTEQRESLSVGSAQFDLLMILADKTALPFRFQLSYF